MKIFRKLLVPALSIALLFAVFIRPSSAYIQGDMNDDTDVTLSDAILIMKHLSKMEMSTPLQKEVGVGSDPRIGLDDLIYVLQVVSQLRSKNTSPVASFSFSAESGEAPFGVKFDASGSWDVEGGSASYLWDFGDGESGTGS